MCPTQELTWRKMKVQPGEQSLPRYRYTQNSYREVRMPFSDTCYARGAPFVGPCKVGELVKQRENNGLDTSPPTKVFDFEYAGRATRLPNRPMA